jgi:signal transduction histidine kinase/ActR/RegA family two-component response regulator/HAMP domain-containing protein
MSWLRDLPIRRKLTLVILLTCTAVLLIACTALAAYELYDYRRNMARDTTVLADILAKNTRAAVAFQDETAAGETLQALQSEPHVVAAVLFARDGARFAEYMRAGTTPGHVPALANDGYRFEGGHLTLFHPVILNEKRIGTLYMRMDLQGIHARLGLFAGISALVLSGSLLMALVLSAWLQRPISGPILSLAETAQAISDRKDYSVRAQNAGKSEIGILTNAFNEMVSGIEQRETALRASNETLRLEIGERKQAEVRVQAQLARLAQLHQITRATGERQDLQSIFQVVVRSLEDHLPVDFACICLYDATSHKLTVSSVGARSEALAAELALDEVASIPVEQNGLSRCVHGHLIYEPDLTRSVYPFPQRIGRAGLNSLVAAPLLIESQVFGALIAARRPVQAFSSGECEFLRQLGEHVALAAHQAQLYGALQQAYDDLRQSQQVVMQQERLRALGQMASGIAHDINNAISPVTLYTESLLETEPNLSTRARDYLTTIQRSMDDVTQTVTRMREFYRQREPQLALIPVNLNNLVSQVLDLTRVRWTDMAQENGVVIEQHTELADNLPAILGVESEIREALTNLIFNAVDAMPQGGKLTLRTRVAMEPRASQKDSSPAAGSAVVEIVDSGIGMDEDTRRRCLEPFFTTKGERGTGLGLAMVYGTVQRHNAEIEIDSAVGKGTCMRILFPIPATATATTTTVIHPPSAPLRMRLLVVDDDPLIIKSLRDILEADGHEVVTANGGQAGMDTFRAAHQSGKSFSVVITDLGMPYIDGRKVASAVKALSPATSVIMLTGWGQRMAADGDIPAHVDRVLSKPPKLRELRAAFAALDAGKAAIPSTPFAT